MATRLQVAAQLRTVTGKKTRFLRRDGVIPANVYGHGVKSQAVQVEEEALRHLVARVTPTTLVSLSLEGATQPVTVVIREVQRNPRNGSVVHVDFHQVRLSERLRTEVPVHLVGVSPAVRRGLGTLIQNLRTIEIEALPDELPPALEIDISGLEDVHNSVHVRDLRTPAGVTVFADPDDVVASIAPPRSQAEVEEAGPTAAEPERITRERAEEA